MKRVTMFLLSVFLLLAAVPQANAGDFGWVNDFNIQAQSDPSGFRARVGARFNIGDLQVNAVLSNFEDPADAYIALRLGEMCDKPVEYVIDQYKKNKGQGWGRLAKSLGIKPGSEQFHALKQGHDMGMDRDSGQSGNQKHAQKKEKTNKDSGKGKKNKH